MRVIRIQCLSTRIPILSFIAFKKRKTLIQRVTVWPHSCCICPKFLKVDGQLFQGSVWLHDLKKAQQCFGIILKRAAALTCQCFMVAVQSFSDQSGWPTNGSERTLIFFTVRVVIILMYEPLYNKETRNKRRRKRRLFLQPPVPVLSRLSQVAEGQNHWLLHGEAAKVA